MQPPHLRILATGGTIAGSAGSALQRGYRPGQIGAADLLATAGKLGLPASFELCQIDARIDQSVFGALSVDSSVAARASYGGTAPVRVREQVAAARQALGMES